MRSVTKTIPVAFHVDAIHLGRKHYNFVSQIIAHFMDLRITTKIEEKYIGDSGLAVEKHAAKALDA